MGLMGEAPVGRLSLRCRYVRGDAATFGVSAPTLDFRGDAATFGAGRLRWTLDFRRGAPTLDYNRMR